MEDFAKGEHFALKTFIQVYLKLKLYLEIIIITGTYVCKKAPLRLKPYRTVTSP